MILKLILNIKKVRSCKCAIPAFGGILVFNVVLGYAYLPGNRNNSFITFPFSLSCPVFVSFYILNRITRML